MTPGGGRGTNAPFSREEIAVIRKAIAAPGATVDCPRCGTLLAPEGPAVTEGKTTVSRRPQERESRMVALHTKALHNLGPPRQLVCLSTEGPRILGFLVGNPDQPICLPHPPSRPKAVPCKSHRGAHLRKFD